MGVFNTTPTTCHICGDVAGPCILKKPDEAASLTGAVEMRVGIWLCVDCVRRAVSRLAQIARGLRLKKR